MATPLVDIKSETAMNGKSPIIHLHEVYKYYKTAAGDFQALKSVDLEINPAEFVSVIGKSGSGKSTLLNMITGIDRPSTWEVFVNGTAVHGLKENRMARWRGSADRRGGCLSSQGRAKHPHHAGCNPRASRFRAW